MKAGFHETDITPPAGIYLAGFGYRTKPSEGVTDPLYLRIAAFEDDQHHSWVVVTADLLKFPTAMCWRLKRWFARATGMDPACLLLNASHTHCGPLLSVFPAIPEWPLNTSYVDSLEKNIQAGIREAMAQMEDIRLTFSMGRADFMVNRRLPAPDGGITWAANEQGCVDQELPILAAYTLRDKLKAVLYSCACHPTSKGGYLISADYPGAISRSLKNRLGSQVHTLFLQGAGGSSKPRFFNPATKAFVQATPAQVDELGEKAGAQIVNSIQSRDASPLNLDLASREKVIKIPFDASKYPSDDKLMEMMDQDCNDCGCPPQINRFWAREVLEKRRTGTLPLHHEMLVNKTRLSGDLALIGASGEWTAEAGTLIKQSSPSAKTIFLGYCFYTNAYIPSDSMLPQGGYEVLASPRYHATAPFAPGIDRILKEEIAKL
ncbi:MAG: hypothetical protein PHV34_21360 [Verrucomicrobiae bacterium]|nr:hypothetical protein [Verrucomicrobiae bacterium]